MRFKVLKYEPTPLNYHFCTDEQGVEHRLDLVCSGSFYEESKDLAGKDLQEFNMELVGKTIEVEYLHPYIEIASGVKIIEKEKS